MTRALHQHGRGHGFESRSSLNFFRLFFRNCLRQRLHERGFKSSRFHALETASKTIRFQSDYTVPFSPFSSANLMPISFPGTVISEEGDMGSSKISRQNSNRIQIDAISPFTRQMKPYRFENAPPLSAFSNRPGFGYGLDRRRVNGRCNRIESDAVTNETAFV